MPLRELTGKRPTTFSTWHRTKLPARCRLADADWFEVREYGVVAIEETIQIDPDKFDEAGIWIYTDPWLHNWYPPNDERYPIWETKKVVLNFLLGSTQKQIFIIYHTPDMSRVKVIDFRRKTLTEYNEDDFLTWLACKW
jgi:hypothetical protein